MTRGARQPHRRRAPRHAQTPGRPAEVAIQCPTHRFPALDPAQPPTARVKYRFGFRANSAAYPRRANQDHGYVKAPFTALDAMKGAFTYFRRPGAEAGGSSSYCTDSDADSNPLIQKKRSRFRSAKAGGSCEQKRELKVDTEGRLSASGTTRLRPNRYSMKAEVEARGHHPYRHSLQRTTGRNVPLHQAPIPVTPVNTRMREQQKRPAPAQRRPGGYLRAEAGAKGRYGGPPLGEWHNMAPAEPVFHEGGG